MHYITSDNLFWLQINNHHIGIPLSKLVDNKQDAQRTPSQQENILKWSDFVTGPIPSDVISGASEIIFVKRDGYASPGYSPDNDQLYFDTEVPVVMASGAEYTLFQSLPKKYKDDAAGGSEINVSGFAIFSSKPFMNGKNWLLFYFQPELIVHEDDKSTGSK